MKRRGFLQMIGLSGLAGLFGRELVHADLAAPEIDTYPGEILEPGPVGSGYCIERIVDPKTGDILVQICSYEEKMNRMIRYVKDAEARLAAGEELWPPEMPEEGDPFEPDTDPGRLWDKETEDQKVSQELSRDFLKMGFKPNPLSKTDWRRSETDGDYLRRILPDHPDYK